MCESATILPLVGAWGVSTMLLGVGVSRTGFFQNAGDNGGESAVIALFTINPVLPALLEVGIHGDVSSGSAALGDGEASSKITLKLDAYSVTFPDGSPLPPGVDYTFDPPPRVPEPALTLIAGLGLALLR